MSQFKSHGIATLTIALTFLACTSALAQTHNLQDLIDTMGDFTVGDKTFHNFSYNAIGDMPLAENVNVIEIFDGEGNAGIRFQSAFLDSTFTPGGSDALITFRVSAPGQFITDVHLSGNPNLLGTAGSISVTEEVFGVLPNGATGPLIARIDIFEDGVAGLKSTDWADFSQPWQTVEVVKDILAFAGNGDVVLSRVDQTFSQVPEPTTALLMMVGLAAVSMVRRKRNA
jgi:hypothetical protein